MRLALIVVAALVAVASASDVVVLTPGTFDQNVRSGNWIVEFYAPWCGHCKRLAPVWEELAAQAAAEKATFKVANIDCDEHKDFCQKFSIRGFPTLKFFQGGKTMYNFPPTGDRSKAALFKFASEGFQKEEAHAMPYDLGGAATGSKPSVRKAQGFLAEIEEALPSTAQKLVEWMRQNVELACFLAGAIATVVGYVLGRITLPSFAPNPPVVVAPAPAGSAPANAAASPDRAAGTPEGVQQRKVAKK